MVNEHQLQASQPTFRHMRAEELDEVFELIQVAFGVIWPNLAIDVPALEHLEWKMNSPQGGSTDAEVIEADGRIIGYLGRAERDLWVRGERIPASTSGDYCIDPDYQEVGLTSTWREWRDAQPPRSTSGLSEGSTHPRILRSTRRQGTRTLVANKVDRLTLPLDLGATVRRGGADGQRVSARSLFRVARTLVRMFIGRLRWRAYSSPGEVMTMRTVESFDERSNALWERAKEAFDYAVVRDRTYLNWRYCDPRAGVYRVRAVEDGDSLAGFIVTGSIGGAAQIVDLLAIPDDESALRALVEDAIAHARTDEATSLTVLMPRRHPYREVFLRYGFIKGHRVSAMGYSEQKTDVLDFLATDRDARIHVASADQDHI